MRRRVAEVLVGAMGAEDARVEVRPAPGVPRDKLFSACREQVPPRAARVVAREAQTVHDAGEEVAVRDARHASSFFNKLLQ